ncbi:MAG: HAMP domain-containing histidine kinase [Oscillospiraceae bacterium]|nr:HAMP domain-containing histidine kinase [Oscillospiraceae bacterium]
MIQRVRKRFFRIAMLALIAAMLLVTAAANLANWINVRTELGETLDAVCMEGGKPAMGGKGGMDNRSRRMKGMLDEARYFTLRLSSDGELIEAVGPTRETELSDDELSGLTARALASGRESGFAGDYLYRVQPDRDGGQRITFLNCETRLGGVRRLLLFSVGACVLGAAAAWLFVAWASRRAVEPLEDNMHRQKRFITDAGHELKTPLTVISANMDVLDMDVPDNPWVQSTQKQVEQMRRLVEGMVALSRAEEMDAPLHLETVELSPLLEESAEPFQPMAEARGQHIETSAPEGLCLECDGEELARVLSILCDNAVKYAPEGDTIRLMAQAEGKWVRIGTENGLTEPLTDEQCARLFDRFYRADPSRSKDECGGFGIGLATASAIAERHGGTAEAALTPEGRLRISLRFPRRREK